MAFDLSIAPQPAALPAPTRARAPALAPRKLGWALAVLGATGVLALYTAWAPIQRLSVFGLWPFFDRHDLFVYYTSSRWVAGGGVLYRDVISEYPLLANLVFGIMHALADSLHPLSTSFDSFAWIWMSTSWLLYLGVVRLVLTRVPDRPLMLWLTPAALYFTLFRFDVYPMLATLFALLAIREDRLRCAALLLGVAIALKGYALFVLPAFAVYVAQRRNGRAAVPVTLLALAPFVAGNLIVFAYAGPVGMTSAYRAHLERGFNGESTWDALRMLFGPGLLTSLAPLRWLPPLLQVGCALGAAAFRPRTFDDLLHAFLIAIIGFITFSVWYSPQFVLWIVPLGFFSTRRALRVLITAFSWLTFAYFPVLFSRRLAVHSLYHLSVLFTALFRPVILAAGVGELSHPPVARER